MSGKSTALRWMILVPCYGLSITLIHRAADAVSSRTVLLLALAAVLLIVLGTALLLPDLFRILSGFAESLYLPGGKFSKPILSYKLPEFYRREERFEEALEQYDKILAHYPRETRAWIGAIELLAEDFGSPEQAEEYYQRALRKLRRDPEALEQLRNCHRSLRATPAPQ